MLEDLLARPAVEREGDEGPPAVVVAAAPLLTLVALLGGGLAGWAVSRFVMDVPYRFDMGSALPIVVGGIAATVVAGLAFAWRPLAARPAQVLRAQD